MQVKKFEAGTMKEALEMVKLQLGPDAIILSAKDLRKGFGLMARESVEVTAAISEMQLRKREIAESKLPEASRQDFRSRSARTQKQFIEKAITAQFQDDEDSASAYLSEAQGEQDEKEVTRRQGNLRYADIEDDEIPALRTGFSGLPAAVGNQVARAAQERLKQAYVRSPVMQQVKQPAKSRAEATKAHSSNAAPTATPTERVKSAVQMAVAASAAAFFPQAAEEKPTPVSAPPVVPSVEVEALKLEIRQLQDVIKGLKTPVPSPLSGMTLHPGAEIGLPFELSPIFEKMTSGGIASSVMMQMITELKKQMNPEQMKRRGLVEAWTARYILDNTHTLARPADGRVHLFVGPSGSGKTSQLVKMASHLLIHERRRVAILSADTFKVGATDQLRIYAQILNIPFGLITKRDDWDDLLNHLTGYDAILVDFPGTALRTLEDIDVFKSLLPPVHVASRVHYVQSCSSRDQDAFELARRYQLADFHDVIFTCLDEASTHGLIFNFQQQFKVPIHSFGLGRMIPEDFEWATRERVVDLLFKITKIRSASERQSDQDFARDCSVGEG